MQNARFQLIGMIDAKSCSHLMFQNLFRKIERQNNNCNLMGDRLELWPSIYFNKCIVRRLCGCTDQCGVPDYFFLWADRNIGTIPTNHFPLWFLLIGTIWKKRFRGTCLSGRNFDVNIAYKLFISYETVNIFLRKINTIWSNASW